MKIIAISTLREFWLDNPEAEQPLRSWYHEVRVAQWESPARIKDFYRSVSILKAGRVVFNIAGNRYRLICQVSYKSKIVFIKFVGTHQEYDQIDAQTIERRDRRG